MTELLSTSIFIDIVKGKKEGNKTEVNGYAWGGGILEGGNRRKKWYDTVRSSIPTPPALLRSKGSSSWCGVPNKHVRLIVTRQQLEKSSENSRHGGQFCFTALHARELLSPQASPQQLSTQTVPPPCWPPWTTCLSCPGRPSQIGLQQAMQGKSIHTRQRRVSFYREVGRTMNIEITVNVARTAPMSSIISFLAAAASSGVSPVAASCRSRSMTTRSVGVGKIDSMNCSILRFQLAHERRSCEKDITYLATCRRNLQEIGILGGVLRP